ncbi:glycerol-3-phosphate dehydrogenase/oxidase [Aestuariivirga sp.]|uniref:glycerol-3-phosphate dehydrogenase/oxidase n=1 Tax=Aestuariivirga sp. TaxID=2650926 RepID=UPI003593D828
MTDPRPNDIAKIRQNGSFDVIVVGGGINGIGTFRDLALQGLRVLLVERDDFCSGCSAAPSRMIHGGLRYLENGEFNLVRESLFERDALLKNAPHMVFPLPTAVPVNSVFSGLLNASMSFLGMKGRPRPRGILPIKLGLSLYDILTRNRRALPPHRVFKGVEARALWPALSPDVRFTAVYHDAWISHPERLAVELVLDAEADNNEAIALNYATIAKAGNGFAVTDEEKGEVLPVSARALVNATGAWLDETVESLGATARGKLVSGTKGSHLILDNPALMDALRGHMIYFENSDGRVCIVFPYLGKVLAGATDIRVKGPSRVRCEDDERDYILRSLQLIFPRLPVSAGDIVYSYSGIRPLPEADVEFTGRISREHFTRRLDGPVPQFCMVGGKWTTFRAFAEQTADLILAELGIPRRASTRDLAIGGGKGEQPRIHDRRASLYGSRAAEVTYDSKPIGGSELTAGEVRFMITHEKARKLGDVLQRRQPLAITGALNGQVISATARVMADVLGWDNARIKSEVESLVSDLVLYHGVKPEKLKGVDDEDQPEGAHESLVHQRRVP